MQLESITEIAVPILVEVENMEDSTPEVSSSAENAIGSKDIILLEKETVLGSAQVCSREFETVNASGPEFVFEIGNTSANKEIPLEKETISPISHDDCFKEIAVDVETTPVVKDESDCEIPCQEELVRGPGSN